MAVVYDEPIKDPLGTILVIVRDDAAVAAIAGDRVSTDVEAPPSVRLQYGVTDLRPFGPNSGRTGVMQVEILLHCYGPHDTDTGHIVARQLAGAVASSLHGKGPTRGSAYLLRTWVPFIGEMLRDPATDRPYHTVRVETYAATQAVAS